MNRDEQDQLLRELLAPESQADFREASLERALAELRRRRRRRPLRLTLLVALPAFFLVGLSWLLQPGGSRRSLVASNGTISVSPRSVAPGAIEYISDEELFRLFPDRSLALIGEPGRQQLVFLGQRRPVERP